MKTLKQVISESMIAVLLSSLFCGGAFAAETAATLLVKPSFQAVGSLSCGNIAVMQDGKWGYIDETGKTTVAPEYDYAANFYEGKALVGKKTEEGAFSLSVLFSDGTIKDLNLTLPAETLFSDEGPIDFGWFNGYLSVGETLLDSEGNPVSRMTDYGVLTGLYSDGLFSATGYDTEGKLTIYFLDENGQPVVSFPCEKPDGKNGDFTFSDVAEFYNGYAAAWVIAPNHAPAFAFVNRDGKILFTGSYDKVATISLSGSQGTCPIASGRIVLRHADILKWGAVSIDGSVCVPFQYEEMMSFSEGLAAVKADGRWGFVNTEGILTIPCIFDEVTPFSSGIALAKEKKDYYILDKNGKKTKLESSLAPKNLSGIVSGTVFPFEKNGKIGLTALSAQPALPKETEMASWAFEEVTRATTLGLVPTTLQHGFRENIQRDEFAELIIKTLTAIAEKTGQSLDIPPAETLYRSNIFKDTWNPDVIAANRLGIINGISSNSFAPKQNLKRQEAAALLMRSAGLLTKVKEPSAASFLDDAEIADYAKTAVSFVTEEGIMNGVGDQRFDPQGFYTKEQACITMLRLYEALIEEKEEPTQIEEVNEDETNGTLSEE